MYLFRARGGLRRRPLQGTVGREGGLMLPAGQWRPLRSGHPAGLRRLPCGERRRAGVPVTAAVACRGLSDLSPRGRADPVGSCAEASTAGSAPTLDGQSIGLERSGEPEMRAGSRASGRRSVEDTGERMGGRDLGACPASTRGTSTGPAQGHTYGGGAGPHCAEHVWIGCSPRADC
ncbi:hypothetical protein NDU88_006254 [Pleurodeles waltl]|uniref:Uncharacterized protein n=1 Tax=Pleurodeles waltl TaxID=8319 RepID=A0AAV7MCE0_PLEWA|nr:hypothetical protein NDU88_006254 [Pleurodeles waltl]